MVLLHVVLQVFLRWMNSDRLEEDSSKDDESSPHPMIPKDCFSEVPVCEEDSHDDADIAKQRYGRHRQPVDRLVEGEDVEETCNEPKAKKCREEHERKCAHILGERVCEEGREHKEYCYGSHRAHEDRNLGLQVVEILPKGDAPDAKGEACKENEEIAFLNGKFPLESLECDEENAHGDCDTCNRVVDSPSFPKNQNRKDDEEYHFCIPEERCINGGCCLKSRKPEERSRCSAEDPYPEQGEEEFPLHREETPDDGDKTEETEEEEECENFTHEEE